MNNFKDYLNFSPNIRDNFYNLSRMTGEQEYYMKLCESLQQKINILEAKMKKKKNKKADKDYDGDGKVESGSEEYLGSRSNAIKKAIAKREAKELKEYTRRQDPPDEEFDEESIKEMQRRIRADEVMAMRKKAASLGGITDDMVNPLPGDITFMRPEQIDALNRAQTGVFGRPTTNRMEKKKSLKEGREVIGGGFIYGGFPRKLNEGGVVSQFNDADDTGNDEKIATKPDGESALWSDESLVHGHYRYPSKELMDLAITADTLQREYLSKRAENRSFEGSPEGRKLGETLHTAKMELYKHPHYTEFRKGHPSRRNRPIISATFSPDAVIDTSREGT